MLGYIAQLLPPSPDLPRIETCIFSKLLSAPGIFMPRAAAARSAEFFQVRFALPSAQCWAALARATFKTFACTAGLAQQVRTAAEASLCYRRVSEGHLWPSFWGYPCIATRIALGTPTIANVHWHSGKDVELAAGMFEHFHRKRPDALGMQKRFVPEFVLSRFLLLRFF